MFYFILGFVLFTLYVLLSLGFLSLNAFSFIAFVAVVAAVIYMDRKNIKLTAGILLMRRTKRFRAIIDRVARRHRTFWSAFGILGVVVAVITMIGGSLLLIDQTVKIATGVTKEGARLILPGPAASLDTPGILFVPWWIWVVAIAFVIIPHETMHGIMCRVDRVRIKSVGWILLAILPGAFVEPDDNQLKKQSSKTKMRVYAAGSFINIFLAGVLLLLLILSFKAFFAPAGVAFFAGDNSSFGENLTASIIEVNGNSIGSVEDLRAELSGYHPGDTVEVKTAKIQSSVAVFTPLPHGGLLINEKDVRTYNAVLKEDNGRAILGISVIGGAYFFAGSVTLYTLLFWLFAISFFVGLVNILPLKPLDGGFLFEEIVKRFTKKDKPIVRAVSMLVVAMIVFNIVGPIILK